jgi:predicted Zn-dependent protease
MLPRPFINALAIAFAVVVFSSFAAGFLMLVPRAWPSAVWRWSASSEAAKTDKRALLDQAAQQLKNGNTEQALIGYRRLLSIEPTSVDAQLGLAKGELLAGREGIARREYERALVLDPQNTTALLSLAEIQSHQPATWQGATTAYRQYLKYQPNDAAAWLALARVLAWQKNSHEAVAIFARKEVGARMTAKDQRDYAFALVRARLFDRAEEALKKLLARQPSDFELNLQLAGIYSARRDWDSALPLYESMLRAKPDDYELNLTDGLGLLSLKRYSEAIPALEKARNQSSNDGRAGLGLARALKGTGNLKSADREFERTLAHFESNAAIKREYADLLLERRDYRKAEKFYKESLGLGLRDDRLLVALAGALSGTRKFKEAIPYLEDVYQREKTDRVAFELAKLYQKTGRNDRALQLISEIESR